MSDKLTLSEAIDALFESTSGFLTLSPRQDENTPLYSSKHSPLRITPKLSNSSSASVATSPPIPLQRNLSLNVTQESATTPLCSPSDYDPNNYISNSVQSSPIPLSRVPSTFPDLPSPIFGPRHPSQESLPDSPTFPTPKCNSPSSPILCHSISSFDLIGTIGCGSYGKVLLGNLNNEILGSGTGTGKLHAIKVLRKRDMHRDGVEEVKRELHALRWIADTARLSVDRSEDRPQGVSFLQKMFESFQNEKFVFIVLEYHPVALAHPSIAARLRLQKCCTPANTSSMPKSRSLPISFPSSPDLQDSSGPNPKSSTLNTLRLISAELVLGLSFLHSSGIVHQDIKPANILLSSTGHIVIADFGASSALPFSFDYPDFPVLPPSQSRARKRFHPIVLNPQDLITFTPLYAPPELVFRNRAGVVIYDENVDWWSLGVVVYELAMGKVPVIATATDGIGMDEVSAERDDVSTRSRTLVRDRDKKPKMNRRSFGDFSLTFGAMEKFIKDMKECVRVHDDGDGNGEHEEVLQLQAFVRALLVDNPSDRLSGHDVKLHAFFEPISRAGLWDEIAKMEYPPLPRPPEVSFDPDVSFGMQMSRSPRTDGSQGMEELAELPSSLRITWPVPREGPEADDPLSLTLSLDSTLDSIEDSVQDMDGTLSMSLSVMSAASRDPDAGEIVSIPSSSDSSSFLLLDAEEDEDESRSWRARPDDSPIQSESQSRFSESETEEDEMNGPASPIQPFPSTASLCLVVQNLLPNVEDDKVAEAEVEREMSVEQIFVADETEVEEDLEVEIWNPWVPRPSEFEGFLYPSESYHSLLPNPYSPQPPHAHYLDHLEPVVEVESRFQSLHSMASVVCMDPPASTSAMTVTDLCKERDGAREREMGIRNDELEGEVTNTITDNPSVNVHAQGGEIQNILDRESSDIDDAHIYHGNGNGDQDRDKGEGSKSLFFGGDSERRREEKTTNKRSLSSLRFSLPTRMPSARDTIHKRTNSNPISSPSTRSDDVSELGSKSGGSSNRRRQRFSFSGSFSGFDSQRRKEEEKKQQQEQEKLTDRTPVTLITTGTLDSSNRRFSAPLTFSSRTSGPPSSFNGHAEKIKSQKRSLLVLPKSSRSWSRTSPILTSTSPTTVSAPPVPPVPDFAAPCGTGLSSKTTEQISSLPFPAHKLDRMRIEYQNRRATDPFPMPCTPRDRGTNAQAHTATLGRSTGTKMIAQARAQAQAMNKEHFSDQGVFAGDWGVDVRGRAGIRVKTPPRERREKRHGHSSSFSRSQGSGQHTVAVSPVANWSPTLQDELTMAVLNAMDSRDSNRDFTVKEKQRAGGGTGPRLEISAPSPILNQTRGQGQDAEISPDIEEVGNRSELQPKRRRNSVLEPVIASLDSTPTTVKPVSLGVLSRMHRASWAGIVGPKGHRIVSRKKGKELELRARRACSSPGFVSGGQMGKEEIEEAQTDMGTNQSLGWGEGEVGSAFEDPCHRLSVSQLQRPQSHHSQTSSASASRHGSGRRLHKRRPGEKIAASAGRESRLAMDTKVKNAAKRRSLGSRLWKKFKKLTGLQL